MKGNIRLQAIFFCYPNGDIIEKARPLFGKERKKIFYRDKGVCVLCGVKVELFGGRSPKPGKEIPSAIDHIFPRSRGGQNNEENLRLLCYRCNGSRGDDIK